MDNQTQTSNDKDILATIDTLDMSDRMKTKMRLGRVCKPLIEAR